MTGYEYEEVFEMDQVQGQQILTPSPPVVIVSNPENPVPSTSAGTSGPQVDPSMLAVLKMFKKERSSTVSTLRGEMALMRANMNTGGTCPDPVSLPTDHPEKKWYPGSMVAIQDNLFVLPSEKPRPEAELEFFISRAHFPNCMFG